MKKTIYLDFGVLDSQAEVEITLEWVEAEVGTVEEGKKMEPDYPAGYVVTGIKCSSPPVNLHILWHKYANNEHFAAAVNQALRDEGVEI